MSVKVSVGVNEGLCEVSVARNRLGADDCVYTSHQKLRLAVRPSWKKADNMICSRF